MSKQIRTTCFDCHSKCGAILTVEGDEIVKVEGDPNHPVSEGILCTKAFSAQEIHSHPDRLKYPLKRRSWTPEDPHNELRGKDEWVRVSWEEALDTITDKVKQLMADYGHGAVATTAGTGRGSNHFMTRLNNTVGFTAVGPGNVCLAPFLMQTAVTWGRQFHPHEAGDYREAGCVVIWGTNPIRSRQYTGLRLLDGKRNGAKIVVVDPVYRDIAARADLWVPVRPGTDGAIALCMTHLVFKHETWKKNPEFLRNWTNGPFLVDDQTVTLLRKGQTADGLDEGEDKMTATNAGGLSAAKVTTTAKFVVWDENSNGPAYWDPATESYDKEDVKPALMGTYTIKMADGTERQFKTVLEFYKDQLEPWTPEAVSPVTWTPVEKLYEMFEIITNPTDGRASLVAPYLGSCMMTTNALQNGRAMTILQMLLEPPVDEPGGILFNSFWEFMSDPRITRPDLRKAPLYTPGNSAKCMLYSMVGGAGPNPGEFWASCARGDEDAPRAFISMASDPLGSQENVELVWKGLTNPRTEMIVSMDYFMNPEGEIADFVLPAAHWSERTGNFDEELYPDPCPFVVPQIAVAAPGEAKDDWYFLREFGKRFNPEVWPWESSEEMQLYRLNEFHLKTVGKDPVTDYEEAAKQGYYVEFGGENRKYKKHETGEVKFATASKKVEIFSEMMVMFGYDWPLPTFNEPYEGPVTQPELFEEYDLVMTTGARDYTFYHSAWTNIAHQRVIEPWPYVEINDEDAEARGIGEGDWVWVESLRGKIQAKARVSAGVLKGCASMCRQNYKHACKELGLPGYSWDKANPNILVDGINGVDVSWGSAPMRGFLVKVTKFSE